MPGFQRGQNRGQLHQHHLKLFGNANDWPTSSPMTDVGSWGESSSPSLNTDLIDLDAVDLDAVDLDADSNVRTIALK